MIDRAISDLRVQLRQVVGCDAHDDSWAAAILASARTAADIAPIDIPEIERVLGFLRELATSEAAEIPESVRGIAWYYIGSISLAQSIQSPADYQSMAETYQRALRFLRRDANPHLWAQMHVGIGIAYCEKLRASRGESFDSWRGSFDSWCSLLVAARSEFEAALSVLTMESYPDDHGNVSELLKWTIESLDKLNKRSGWPAA